MQDCFQGRGVIRRDDKAPGAHALLDDVAAGDTLTVWKVDRLGRSLRDLIAHSRLRQVSTLRTCTNAQHATLPNPSHGGGMSNDRNKALPPAAEALPKPSGFGTLAESIKVLRDDTIERGLEGRASVLAPDAMAGDSRL